jgi:hypothetical protein
MSTGARSHRRVPNASSIRTTSLPSLPVSRGLGLPAPSGVAGPRGLGLPAPVLGLPVPVPCRAISTTFPAPVPCQARGGLSHERERAEIADDPRRHAGHGVGTPYPVDGRGQGRVGVKMEATLDPRPDAASRRDGAHGPRLATGSGVTSRSPRTTAERFRGKAVGRLTECVSF